jgi:hypothetical protein
MEKITKNELDMLMIYVQKGLKALGLLKDAQTARKKYPQYNYILSGLYDEIYTSTIETILLQLTRLYVRNNNLPTLFTLAENINDKKIKKEFYETKDSLFESQEFMQYMQRWRTYNGNEIGIEPDYTIPVSNVQKLLDFAEKYIREAGKTIDVKYGEILISTNSLTGLMDFVEKK